jgi:hypothetical protein
MFHTLETGIVVKKLRHELHYFDRQKLKLVLNFIQNTIVFDYLINPKSNFQHHEFCSLYLNKVYKAGHHIRIILHSQNNLSSRNIYRNVECIMLAGDVYRNNNSSDSCC